jgi:hypothetical protein
MSNAGKLVVLGAGNIGQDLLGGLTRESDLGNCCHTPFGTRMHGAIAAVSRGCGYDG